MDERTPPLPAPALGAWFFDVDGTLLEIAATPFAVSADPAVEWNLRRLCELAGGALALISGRSIAAVDTLFQPLRLPVAGQHGAERRDASFTLHRHSAKADRLDAVRAAVRTWISGQPGLLLEDKGLSLAVHYRLAPEKQERVRDFLARTVAAVDQDLRLQEGKMVLEVNPAGCDKGMAIREYLDEPPFRGRFPVFVGDDFSDEYGFRMINRLGGASIKVGAGATDARSRLPDVSAVRRWLGELVGRAG